MNTTAPQFHPAQPREGHFAGTDFTLRPMCVEQLAAAAKAAYGLGAVIAELIMAVERDEAPEALMRHVFSACERTDEWVAFLHIATGLDEGLIRRAYAADALVLTVEVIRANAEVFARVMPHLVNRELAKIPPTSESTN